jgi:hypothetical protein
VKQVNVDSTFDGRLNIWDEPWDGKTLLDPDTPVFRRVSTGSADEKENDDG